MLHKLIGRVILALVGLRSGKLVAYAFHSVFIGHHGRYGAILVEPILDMMLVAPLTEALLAIFPLLQITEIIW